MVWAEPLSGSLFNHEDTESVYTSILAIIQVLTFQTPKELKKVTMFRLTSLMALLKNFILRAPRSKERGHNCRSTMSNRVSPLLPPLVADPTGSLSSPWSPAVLVPPTAAREQLQVMSMGEGW